MALSSPDTAPLTPVAPVAADTSFEAPAFFNEWEKSGPGSTPKGVEESRGSTTDTYYGRPVTSTDTPPNLPPLPNLDRPTPVYGVSETNPASSTKDLPKENLQQRVSDLERQLGELAAQNQPESVRDVMKSLQAVIGRKWERFTNYQENSPIYRSYQQMADRVGRAWNELKGIENDKRSVAESLKAGMASGGSAQEVLARLQQEIGQPAPEGGTVAEQEAVPTKKTPAEALREAYTSLSEKTEIMREVRELGDMLKEEGLSTQALSAHLEQVYGKPTAEALVSLYENPELGKFVGRLLEMKNLSPEVANQIINEKLAKISEQKSAKARREALKALSSEAGNEEEGDDPEEESDEGRAAERRTSPEKMRASVESVAIGVNPAEQSRMYYDEYQRLLRMEKSGDGLNDSSQLYAEGRQAAKFRYIGERQGGEAVSQAIQARLFQRRVADALMASQGVKGDDQLGAFEADLRAQFGDVQVQRLDTAGKPIQRWEPNLKMKVSREKGRVKVEFFAASSTEQLREGEGRLDADFTYERA